MEKLKEKINEIDRQILELSRLKQKYISQLSKENKYKSTNSKRKLNTCR